VVQKNFYDVCVWTVPSNECASTMVMDE